MTEAVVVDEKSQFGVPSHIFAVLLSLQDFTYIAFKDLLCGNCIVLAIHHIE